MSEDVVAALDVMGNLALGPWARIGKPAQRVTREEMAWREGHQNGKS